MTCPISIALAGLGLLSAAAWGAPITFNTAFAPDGTFSHKWGGPFAVNIFGPFNGWFATVTSVAVDGAGRLFVADFYNHRIQKFSADGTFLTRFGTNGSRAGQFEHPIAAALAGDGGVYVVDYGNNRVTRWRPSTQ